MSKTPPSGNKSYNVHGNTTHNDCHREEEKKVEVGKNISGPFLFSFLSVLWGCGRVQMLLLLLVLDRFSWCLAAAESELCEQLTQQLINF